MAQLCRAISSQWRHISTVGKKHVEQQCFSHMSSQYGELRSTSGWDPLASLGHPSTFQRVSRLGSVTARHSSSGRQPNFAALNKGRHLYSAGRPSRWVLARISNCCIKCRIPPAFSHYISHQCISHHISLSDSFALKWSRRSISVLLACLLTYLAYAITERRHVVPRPQCNSVHLTINVHCRERGQKCSFIQSWKRSLEEQHYIDLLVAQRRCRMCSDRFP